MAKSPSTAAFKMPDAADMSQLVQHLTAIEAITRRSAKKYASRGAARAANLAQQSLALLLPSVEECHRQIIQALTAEKPDLERATLLANLVRASGAEADAAAT